MRPGGATPSLGGRGNRLRQRLNGIFAFALFDKRERKLFLGRDPLGVKPLVYAIRDGCLAFGSEAKAVLASGLITAELDEASLHLAMNIRYVPGGRTFFQGIRRLPGSVLEFRDGRTQQFDYAHVDWTPDKTLTRDDWAARHSASLRGRGQPAASVGRASRRFPVGRH
jgi:asparagine synthase (glutamine-hydrolysing)